VAPVAAPSVHTLLYTTRRGDTLVSIADRFGVSLDQLRRWNRISSGIKVEPGRRLHVAEPSSTQRSSSRSRAGLLSQGAKHGKSSGIVEKTSSRAIAKPAARAGRHNSQQKTYAEKQK
jgi:membrane-bound lytic murein transglycosylase D